MSTRYVYQPDYAVPPGETLREIMDHASMGQQELAAHLGLTPEAIDQIMCGQAPITHAVAARLERVTGMPARFWLRREAIYRERLAAVSRHSQP